MLVAPHSLRFHCGIRLIIGIVLSPFITSAVVGQQMQWGFDFTTGNVGAINNDGTGGGGLAGQPISNRGVPTYSSDIPPASRRQNTTGIGSVNLAGNNATLATIGGTGELANEAELVAAGGLTIQAWFKGIETPQGGANIGALLDVGGAMLLREVNGGFSVLVNSSGLPTPFVAVGDLEKQSQWNHLAAIWATNGTTHTLSIYLNGTLASTLPHPQVPVLNQTTTIPITVGGRNLDNLFDLEGLVYEPTVTLGVLSPSQFTTNGAPPAPVLLELEVDRATGKMTLTNPTGIDKPILGYRIFSTAGALNRANWKTVAANYDATGTGPAVGTLDSDDNWTVLTGAGVYTDLSEAQLVLGPGLEDGGVVQTTDSFDFGNVWIRSPVEDIQVEFLTPDDSIVAGKVVFTGNGGASYAPGDLNFDGSLSIADWLTFKGVYGTNVSGMSRALAYQNGDLNNDQISDLKDFIVFEDIYDTAFGVGALRKAIAAVPEPSSTLIALVSTLGLTACGRRRREKRRVSSGGKRTLVSKSGNMVIRGVLLGAICMTLQQPAAEAQQLKWGFDFTSGSVGLVDGGTVNNDGTGGAQLAGQRIADRGVPVYRSDIPPSNLRQNTTGIGSVDFFGNNGTLRSVGTVSSLATNASVVAAGGITLQTWFKQTATPQGGVSIGSLIDIGGAMVLRDVAGGFSVLVNSSGFPTPFVAMTDAQKRSDWNHLAAIWSTDGTNHALSIYLNGTLAQSLAHPQVPVFNAVGSLPIAVGGRGADNLFDLEGLLYEPQINLGALTPSQFTVRKPTNLTLEVNTTTGVVQIRNLSAIDEHALKSYSITSPSGSLSAGAWTSMQDQAIDDPTPADKNNGDGWEKLGTPSANQLAEAKLIGNSLVSPSEDISLGAIFRRPSADFNNSGIINTADFTQWKGAFGVNALADADGDGDSDGADFLAWQRGFGGTVAPPVLDLILTYTLENGNIVTVNATPVTSSAAGSSVPEPAGLALTAFGLAGFSFALRRGRRSALACTPQNPMPLFLPRHTYRRRMTCIFALVLCCLPINSAHCVVRNDRDYRLGDDLLENGVVGQTVGGVTYDSSGPSGAFLDLTVLGDPKYMNASNRPGAAPGARGIAFDGGDQLTTGISFNAPTQMWDNSVFFPSLDYPLNYEGIYGRGIQLWAKPTLPVGGTQQDLVIDTPQHGIVITSTGNWGLQFAGTLQSSTTPVSSTVDANGWVHVMELAGGRDLKLAKSLNGGALLVNGVVVAASSSNYTSDSSNLSIGSNQAGTGNFYHGALDDIRLFLWGNNSSQTNGGMGPNGTNYGTLDLGTDNDWIARQLASMNVTSRADVNLNGTVSGNGTGSVANDDVSAFVANWGYRQVINGLTVGDWNSRQRGDLNYDGFVDLRDAFILHEGLVLSGGSGLDFSLLNGVIVPEPSGKLMLTIGGALGFARIGRRRFRPVMELLKAGGA